MQTKYWIIVVLIEILAIIYDILNYNPLLSSLIFVFLLLTLFAWKKQPKSTDWSVPKKSPYFLLSFLGIEAYAAQLLNRISAFK